LLGEKRGRNFSHDMNRVEGISEPGGKGLGLLMDADARDEKKVSKTYETAVIRSNQQKSKESKPKPEIQRPRTAVLGVSPMITPLRLNAHDNHFRLCYLLDSYDRSQSR
jgi:hypothetical protein